MSSSIADRIRETIRTMQKQLLNWGAWIGDSGNTLVYGGSSVGLMGLISRVVLEHGGEVYGVEPQFFTDAGVEQQDLTELYVVENMSERKAKMIELGDVFVALPGGVGTLEEISEIMSRIRLHLTPGPCFALISMVSMSRFTSSSRTCTSMISSSIGIRMRSNSPKPSKN